LVGGKVPKEIQRFGLMFEVWNADCGMGVGLLFKEVDEFIIKSKL
jgi:hypothetical protein